MDERVKVSLVKKKNRTSEWKLQDSKFQFNLRKLQKLVGKEWRRN